MIVPARFNGPPGSGNGGYSAGVMAGAAPGDGDWEVTLRRPVPLDRPLSIVDGRVSGPDGELVAEVGPAAPIETAVPPVDYAEAVEAAKDYAGFSNHPFPTCFGCGPDHADGLRIFPGRLPDGTTAAPWVPPPDLTPPMVWAALDCTGGWTVVGEGRPYVLGRLAVRVGRAPAPGDPCVVRGALEAMVGRRALVHTTLYGPGGVELARARATWVAVA